MKFSPCVTIHQNGHSPPIWEALSHADIRVLFPLLVSFWGSQHCGAVWPRHHTEACANSQHDALHYLQLAQTTPELTFQKESTHDKQE